jgi:para-nitrobenzyl esterase
MQTSPKKLCCQGLQALALLALFLLHSTPLFAGPVSTAQGQVEGSSARREGVTAWLGLPYAAPPVGAARWQPPAPPSPWDGVRTADAFGPRCMQTNPFADMNWNSATESEDCLYLSVWAPQGAQQLPVMLWIHGGGYFSGAGDEVRHDGSSLAARGVVVVTINYRLGVFGFMAHPELSKESSHHSSGNYAVLDMLAALQWVQANIAGFGGDPGNVTLFGESAGSFAVATLMAIPMAQGLFHKAIGQSGAPFARGGLAVPDLATAEAQGQRLAAALGAATPAELRQLDAGTVRDASAQGFGWSPNVDGYVLPQHPADIFKASRQNDVPLLAGWTSAEAKWVRQNLAEFEAARAAAFAQAQQQAARLYPASNDAEAYQAGVQLGSDNFIAYGTWKWIETQAATGKSAVYRYLFDQVMATPQGPVPTDDPGAAHATDIPFVFDRLDITGNPVSAADQATADLMGAYWTAFARSGDPNTPGLPTWPPFQAADGQVMVLKGEPAAVPEPQRARYQFMDAQP